MDTVSAQRTMARSTTSKPQPKAAAVSPFRDMLRRRSKSAPPAAPRRKLIEEHYRVDTAEREVLPGVPKHGDDWARDAHDFFNLVVLVR